MSVPGNDTQERPTVTRKLVEQLVQQRQQLLVLYCQVAGLEPYTCKKPLHGTLQEFCQALIDYIALGHFEVYERLSSGDEQRRSLSETVDRLYAQLQDVTQDAVAFNDRYAGDVDCQYLESLPQDLSRLGESLAARVELEDQLINTLLADGPAPGP